MKKYPVLWTVLLLALLSLSISGVRAYLLHSDDAVKNTFLVDSDPAISIDHSYVVTVSNTAYPVYLRAAVVVNWKNGDEILATVPTNYTPEPGTGWVKHDDGFYYYIEPVNAGDTIPAVLTNPPTGKQDGYTLVADVAVQAIQAIGTTDGTNPVDAVQNAWGISGADIQALSNS